jgi:uncharacterized protein YjiS (DUF1127 family)
MQPSFSCNAAIYCATQRRILILLVSSSEKLEKGRVMLTSFIRFVQSWRQYGETVRELSNLNDRELADLGITRSDIPHVAREHLRH